ncbi:MAG: glycosyltransferase [Halioglobus sp.]
MQRDFYGILEALCERGHDCRVYCTRWEGAPPEGVDVRQLPVRALRNHRRDAQFHAGVLADLAREPVDGVMGFTRMPGLDVYFAGDACYRERMAGRPGWWRRYSPRYRHFAAAEQAVYGAAGGTHILCIASAQRAACLAQYHTPQTRLHLLPPGIRPDRAPSQRAAAERRALRASLNVAEGELVLLFVASAFATKGLDRAIGALAHLLQEQPGRAHACWWLAAAGRAAIGGRPLAWALPGRWSSWGGATMWCR